MPDGIVTVQTSTPAPGDGLHPDSPAPASATPPLPAPASIASYVSALSASGDLVSVNTGNASVKQLDSLSALVSTPPAASKDVNPMILLLALGLVFLF